MKQYNNRNEGQMIFKNIFEYNTKGLLNDNEFCELMRLIYCMRWDEDNYDPTNVSDKVKIIWQGIEPTFRKSKSNAEYYEKKQNTKTTETKHKDNKNDIVQNDFEKNVNNNIVLNNYEKIGNNNPITTDNNNDVNENDLQLLLGTLYEEKPQKNQTFQMALWNNHKISEFVEKNKINKSTREKAWKLYIK